MGKTTKSQETNKIFEKEVGNISVKIVHDELQGQVFVSHKGVLIYKFSRLLEEFPFEESLEKMDKTARQKYYETMFDDFENFKKLVSDISEVNRQFITFLFLKITGKISTFLNGSHKTDIVDEANNSKKNNRIKILDDIVDAGQLKYDNGVYKLNTSTLKDFIKWCVKTGGYINEKKGDPDDLTPEFIHENIETGCKEDTIRKAISEFKVIN